MVNLMSRTARGACRAGPCAPVKAARSRRNRNWGYHKGQRR